MTFHRETDFAHSSSVTSILGQGGGRSGAYAQNTEHEPGIHSAFKANSSQYRLHQAQTFAHIPPTMSWEETREPGGNPHTGRTH